MVRRRRPRSFDCSGLMMAAWAAAGVSMDHSSSAQAYEFPAVSEKDIQPGDMVIYYGSMHHVGMYVGGGMVIHAPYRVAPWVQYAPMLPCAGGTDRPAVRPTGPRTWPLGARPAGRRPSTLSGPCQGDEYVRVRRSAAGRPTRATTGAGYPARPAAIRGPSMARPRSARGRAARHGRRSRGAVARRRARRQSSPEEPVDEHGRGVHRPAGVDQGSDHRRWSAPSRASVRGHGTY